MLKLASITPEGRPIIEIRDRRFVSTNSNLIVNCIGMWARQVENFPLHVESFNEILLKQYYRIDRVMTLVQDKFVFVPNDDKIIRQAVIWQVRKSYNQHRHALHQIFESYEGDDVMSIRPTEVPVDDWKYLTEKLWVDPKFVEKCERNKKNRSLQKMGHTGGTRSNARLISEKTKKGEPTDRVTIYMETHTRKKDGLPVDEASAIAMARMQELSSQVSEGVASLSQEQIFTEVMGEDRKGRKRACGAGPTPSGYYVGQSSRSSQLQEKLDEANAKIEENKKELDDAKKKMSNMEKQLKLLLSLAPQQPEGNLEDDFDEDEDDLVGDDDANGADEN